MFHAVNHDLVRRPKQKGRLAVKIALSIPTKLDERRIVAALGILALTRVEAERLDLQALGPLLEPEARIIKVVRFPLALLRVDWIALPGGHDDDDLPMPPS